MHSAFLYHAIKAGLDMAIVNAGQLAVYEEVDGPLLERVEDVLFNRRPDATERLVEIAEIKDHPFMLGTQFHPEFLSRPYRAHPLFAAFIKAALDRSKN